MSRTTLPLVRIVDRAPGIDSPNPDSAHATGTILCPKNDGTGYDRLNDAAITDAAAAAALTAAAPAALTSPAGGAGSGADATTFSGAQCDALRADVVELRTQLVAAVADAVALRATVELHKTALNAALAALRALGAIPS